MDPNDFWEFRDFFSNLLEDLALKMARIWGEFLMVSVSQETKHENNSGQNSGRKFEKFGALSFLQFF